MPYATWYKGILNSHGCKQHPKEIEADSPCIVPIDSDSNSDFESLSESV